MWCSRSIGNTTAHQQNNTLPTVLIGSSEQHPVPPIRGALKLTGLAEANGWTARPTYALAEMPDEFYLNGNLARPAHRLATVVVRLRRSPSRGWASWHSEDDSTFRFVNAFVDLERFGWGLAAKLPSILERITRP